MKSSNGGQRRSRAIKMVFISILAAAILLLVAFKDPFPSGMAPSAIEHSIGDQTARRLGRHPLGAHGQQERFANEGPPHASLVVAIDDISVLDDSSTGNATAKPGWRTTKNLDKGTLLQRNLKYGGSIAVATGLLLLAGAIVAVRKKGIIELYCPRWRGCCKWPPFQYERYEYSVLGSDGDGGKRRRRIFFSPMPPLASMAYLKLQTQGHNFSDVMQQALDSILNPHFQRLSTKEDYDNTSNAVEEFSSFKGLLRMKNVAEKDRVKIERDLERIKRRRKCLLTFLFLAYVAVCMYLPFNSRREVSCLHGFFWESHIPFASSFFINKVIELLIYWFDHSLDGELGFRKFMLFFSLSFFGYTDGYRDVMAVEIADACAHTDISFINSSLAETLHTTMYYSYYGGVVLVQWCIFGLLGIACDPSSAILAKLLHMDVLAACITLPSNQMWLWYGVNIAITVGENIPQGLQQMILVRFVKRHLFLTVAITFSVISSVQALVQACNRLAQALGMAEASSRQAKTHAVETHAWLNALEGRWKSNEGCQGSNRTEDWSSRLVLHNRGVVHDFYEIKNSNLGSGSFGKVNKWMHKGSQMIRAVKTLDKAGQELEYIWREVQIMKELDHPNVLRLIETFHDHNTIYMVMELCEGGDLLEFILNREGLKEEEAAIVMQQASQSLYYVHSCQICHRDVKPENFLLQQKGPINEETVVKLIDFGTARGFETNQALQTKMGTPSYMAPEVIRESYNHLCDAWSLGIMLYAMLSCRIPFNGANEPMIHRAILQGNLQFPEEFWGQVSDKAKELVKMLLTEQSKRCSPKGILEHEWTKTTGPARQPADAEELAGLPEKLLTFGSQSEFKKLVLMAMAYNLPDRQLESRRRMFKAIDSDEDGVISLRELRAIVGSSAGDADKILQGVDVDGNTRIDYTEFLAATLDSSFYTSPMACWQAYQLFDRHGEGVLRSREFRMVLRNDADADIKRIFGHWDKDVDGSIDFVEFLGMMGI